MLVNIELNQIRMRAYYSSDQFIIIVARLRSIDFQSMDHDSFLTLTLERRETYSLEFILNSFVNLRTEQKEQR